MSDPNKFTKLREIGYTLPNCCAICKHRMGGFYQEKSSWVQTLSTPWGYCLLHTYQHDKHTNPEHSLGVLSYGCCNSFVRDEEALAKLYQSYAEFLKP